MEKTQLVIDVEKQILQNLNETKIIVQKQTHIFEHLLISKIVEKFKNINKEKLHELFIRIFTTKLSEELDELFNYYKLSEMEFYNKNLKTTDLIFNSLSDRRTQVIYLENLIKKLVARDDNTDSIFTNSIKNKNNEDNIDSLENLSINSMFDQFIATVSSNPRLSMDDVSEFTRLATHYYNLYKNDVSLVIKKFLDDNRNMVIDLIEDEMDNRNLRNGKTSAVSRVERSITNNYLKIMGQALVKIVSNNKIIAKEELKVCSLAMIDLIFRLLPFEYQEQKELLEIIIDTNINERLGRILDLETKKITDNLYAKNQDMIENELYEEKRYKKINDYECNYEMIEKVYQDVLHEIRIAYDIPDDEYQSKKLDLIVLSESNSTKNVFKKLIDSINIENKKSLDNIIIEMHLLSLEARNSDVRTNHVLRK